MATLQMNGIVRHIQSIALQNLTDVTDGDLLDAFVQERNDEALTALIVRHGPMVWGVCRRLLRNHHEAEDAFQATFLVLVRKAATIRDRQAVANWLYGVASQTATRLRWQAQKRSAREQLVIDMPESTAKADHRDDLLPFLDQELGRLPAKYRTLIVLCDLEGKTRKDVASQLGCPEGTVAGRLARARTMLAKRLSRHWLAISAGALAIALSDTAAAVPPALASTAITAANLIASGKATAGPISATVAALTDEVVKIMLLSKLKTVSAVLLLVGLLGTATFGLSRTLLAFEQPKTTMRPAEEEKTKADSSAKARQPDKAPMSDKKTNTSADPVLAALQTQLERELRDVKPAPTFEVPKSSLGKSLLMRYLTKEYLVYPRNKAGRLGADLEKREGPQDDGVFLSIHLQPKGEVNQLVTPQSITEPYWSTFINVHPVAGTEKQLYVALSFRGRADRELIKTIKKVMEQTTGGKEAKPIVAPEM